MFDLPPRPGTFGPEHEDFRASVRAFVRREIEPHAAAWDEAGTFPRELYRKAAGIGLLGIGYPEALGGTPADLFYALVAAEEIALAGSGGVQASLGSHHIALPPIGPGRSSLVTRHTSLPSLSTSMTRLPSVQPMSVFPSGRRIAVNGMWGVLTSQTTLPFGSYSRTTRSSSCGTR